MSFLRNDRCCLFVLSLFAFMSHIFITYLSLLTFIYPYLHTP